MVAIRQIAGSYPPRAAASLARPAHAAYTYAHLLAAHANVPASACRQVDARLARGQARATIAYAAAYACPLGRGQARATLAYARLTYSALAYPCPLRRGRAFDRGAEAAERAGALDADARAASGPTRPSSSGNR